MASVAIVLVGAALRLWSLQLKPLHHDEGVNGYFLLSLFREGIYRYDPANYHGPTLYYFALISSSINNLLFGVEGPSTIAIRAVPVFFGITLIVLVLKLRRYLGTLGVLTAAGLIALSPGMVYLSRDFIHETLLGFFSLWLVICCLRFWETRRITDLLLASVAAALMFSTKETAPISLFCMALGAMAAFAWVPSTVPATAASFGGRKRIVLLAIATMGTFVICCVLFFSSFFGNYPQGIRDAVTTYTYWARTGLTQQTAPWHTYLRWLLREEGPILVLAAIGTITAVVRRRSRFAVFAGVWGFGLLVAYSLLPYKTPWIMLNMLIPMSMVAGYALQKLWITGTRGQTRTRTNCVTAVLLSAGIICGYQSIQLNFFRYDDDRYVYPYVQTSRGFQHLVDEVNGIAQSTGSGNQLSMAVLSPHYWPLPWYLRDYKNVGYFGRLEPTEATVVIGSGKQRRVLEGSLGDRYRFAGSYPLRPGSDLVLFVLKTPLQ
ncbi:MAG TPA: flippase activity-associated protein Agl23 [Terriglobales bacterium]|nr:flippase activity-associated protein Agl23 [Terriglobales bacterium]